VDGADEFVVGCSFEEVAAARNEHNGGIPVKCELTR
jgi:hypothetical protein